MKKMVLIVACIAALTICSVAGAADQSQLQTMNKQAKLGSVDGFVDTAPIAVTTNRDQAPGEADVDRNSLFECLIRMADWF